MITKDKVKIQDFRGKTNFDKKKTFYTKKKTGLVKCYILNLMFIGT